MAGALAISPISLGCGGATPGSDSNDNHTGNGNSNENPNENPNGNSNECTEDNMCFVDFPCAVDAACVLDASSLMIRNETYPCTEVCGPCCSGAGCNPGVVSCPAGQVCAYPDAEPTTFSPPTRYHYGDDFPRCIPEAEACGGPEGRGCPDQQYCELVGLLCPEGDPWPDECLGAPRVQTTDLCDYGAAGGYGICRPMPDPSSCASSTFGPVCGCDGQTYENDCLRRAAGLTLRYTGPCDS
jgi:hypothetical protein